MNEFDTELDPEQQLDASNVGQPTDLGSIFTFKGIALQPYTFTHRAFINRMTQHDMSGIEYAVLVLFSCTKSRTEISKIRSQEQRDAFHLESEEWADVQGLLSREASVEAINVSAAILKAVDEANNWQPEAPAGALSEAPGNAPCRVTRRNTSRKSVKS